MKLIAIGASTGGTEAIEKILRQLPAGSPPVVVVQHIPAGFSKAFADRLDGLCRIQVREAVNGDAVSPGLALVAPGNFHMRFSRSGGRSRVTIGDGPLVCYQRPAVDVLFESVAEAGAAGVVAVLLTGMGSDGALGMKNCIRRELAPSRRTNAAAPSSACRVRPSGWVRWTKCSRSTGSPRG